MLLATLPCLLSLLLVPAPRPAAAVLGPPTVCHPIAIGDAASLPWKSGAFGRDPAYDVGRVVEDTLALLDGSDATFVHMETLRRAVIYLAETGKAGSAVESGGVPTVVHDRAWRLAEAQRLLAALQERTTVAAPGALRWFDLGYTRVALSQMGLPMSTPPSSAAAGAPGAASSTPSAADLVRSPLEKAVALAPDDGALQLGLAIAFFDGPARDEAASLEHLDRALALAEDPRGLLRTNLLGTMGRFLGAETHEALVAAVRERRQRA